jgi:DNA-directed RNA polymerase subunit L
MEPTLTYSDVVNRVGYTVIDGVKVVQYSCSFPLDNPSDMRITSTRMNPDLYKAHREICRADLATFEDAAYDLQDEWLEKLK